MNIYASDSKDGAEIFFEISIVPGIYFAEFSPIFSYYLKMHVSNFLNKDCVV